jgi:hypothetical protein
MAISVFFLLPSEYEDFAPIFPPFFPKIYLLCKYGDVFSFIFLQNMVETLPEFFPKKSFAGLQHIYEIADKAPQ